MKLAKYYIYYNLHKHCWSVKYKGKVIEHLMYITMYNVSFNVSESGRQRVLINKRKNVHAYAVCESYEQNVNDLTMVKFQKISYNPYTGSHFFNVLYPEISINDGVIPKVLAFDKCLYEI